MIPIHEWAYQLEGAFPGIELLLEIYVEFFVRKSLTYRGNSLIVRSPASYDDIVSRNTDSTTDSRSGTERCKRSRGYEWNTSKWSARLQVIFLHLRHLNDFMGKLTSARRTATSLSRVFVLYCGWRMYSATLKIVPPLNRLVDPPSKLIKAAGTPNSKQCAAETAQKL